MTNNKHKVIFQPAGRRGEIEEGKNEPLDTPKHETPAREETNDNVENR